MSETEPEYTDAITEVYQSNLKPGFSTPPNPPTRQRGNSNPTGNPNLTNLTRTPVEGDNTDYTKE